MCVRISRKQLLNTEGEKYYYTQKTIKILTDIAAFEATHEGGAHNEHKNRKETTAIERLSHARK